MSVNDAARTNSIYVTTEAFMIAISERMAGVMPDVTINKSVLWAPEDIALRRRAEVLDLDSSEKGKQAKAPADYELDFISVFTPSINVAWDRQRASVALAGGGLKIKYDDGSMVIYRAVPINLQFEVIYWSKQKQNIDRFLQEISFWHYEKPTLRLYIDELEIPFQFLISPDMSDGGTVARMYDDGKYWQLKSKINVESWVFKDAAVHTAKHIEIDMYNTMQALPETLLFTETIDA